MNITTCLIFAQVGSNCLTFFVPPQGEEAPLVRDEEEDAFVIEKSSQDFLEVRKAGYIGIRKRIQREKELLYTPSNRPGTMLSTKPHNSQPSLKYTVILVLIFCSGL